MFFVLRGCRRILSSVVAFDSFVTSRDKSMPDALIGHSGFVGSTLLKQTHFHSLFNSMNVHELVGKKFELIVCAAAPAQKWLANKEPQQDLANITKLIHYLKQVQCQTFILISTVDVFKNPDCVNEDSTVDECGLQPYGLHRRLLEKFVTTNFKQHLIVRLPGLVGSGLKKNILFDFLNHNNLHSIDSRAQFQFYPMINLWSDIQLASQEKLNLVHLTSEPILVSEVAKLGFACHFDTVLDAPIPFYNLQSKFARVFGGNGLYQYNKREILLAIRSYAQSEPQTIKH